jgi:hypothetical protein
MDQDLKDDMLKLVRYKILFVKRDYEHAFPEQEDLIWDNLDGSSFTSWKIAEFIQGLHAGNTRVPEKWKNRKDAAWADFTKGDYLLGLPEGDKKYLRVFYQVLDRYRREPFRYEETQVDLLREIRDRLPASAKDGVPPESPAPGQRSARPDRRQQRR